MATEAPAPAPPVEARKEKPAAESKPSVPFLLDFYPLENEKSTQLMPFFTALREHRLTTTRCRKDGLFWPPRLVCPQCHQGDLEWVDLPSRGRIYAFSAVLAGAPMGMEADVPYVVGLIDLDGSPLRLFGRIVGTPWNECRVGQSVEVETYAIPDGRWFYRFRISGR
ncbi:MAG: OB-fold domain-containing protein [Thermoplasmata archaeon]|nr:OB-fold domain-containing protein [Thermoplasmata archaeon]